jgi:hypothetical protein
MISEYKISLERLNPLTTSHRFHLTNALLVMLVVFIAQNPVLPVFLSQIMAMAPIAADSLLCQAATGTAEPTSVTLTFQ